MDFFFIFLFVLMLAIQYSRSDVTKECNKTTYIPLINAASGMRFYLENNLGRQNVIYDCSLDTIKTGRIAADDSVHPQKIDSLFIKNCTSLSVSLNTDKKFVESLHITGVQEVIINGYCPSSPKIVITDVESLQWYNGQREYYHYTYYSVTPNRYTWCNQSVVLKNVVLTDFDSEFVKSLDMTDVKVKRLRLRASSGSKLSIKDSSFVSSPDMEVFDGVEQVYIVNNTFDGMESKFFHFRVNESFVFSNNHVKNQTGWWHVQSPKVEITGNRFDFRRNSGMNISLSHFESVENSIKSVNVSLNVFENHFGLKFDEDSEPDHFTMERNYFNCSCGNILNIKKIFNNLFLDDYSNNVCINFENCPLNKVSRSALSVCSNTFVCPHDFSEDAITLKEIKSQLKNLTETVNCLIQQNNEFD